MHIIQKVAERWVLSDLRLTTARVNADVGDLAASADVRAQSATPVAPTVNVEEIAPGVWYLNGQTHHSVAIEQQRSIVLVEAPQSEERTLAVIERARGLAPGKPVDVVINTHHHFDHSAGIRAAISQGLTVLTHEGNRDFFERTIFPARHVTTSDAQARNPKPLRLLPLGDKYVRRDSLRTIETYQILGSQHSGTMVMVYLPAERLLIQADLYNPPAANATAPISFPFAANLLENIQRRGLAVDRVVGIHGRVVPLSDIQAAAKTP
jgi:glyoxylase-like metal-dependent hydrolase (beta-lactamase superfamily II)